MSILFLLIIISVIERQHSLTRSKSYFRSGIIWFSVHDVCRYAEVSVNTSHTSINR